MNRKGADPQSIIYTIIVLVSVGIVITLLSNVFSRMYDQFDRNFDNNNQLNGTTAHETLNDIQDVENSVWDYAFLAIFFSYVFFLEFSAYQLRTITFFFWMYVILGILGLFLGTVMSNLWGVYAANSQNAEVIARFPITNLILGEYYPLVVTIIIGLSLVLLFGKQPEVTR